MSTAFDAETERLLEERQEGRARPLPARELAVESGFAALTLAVVIALAVLAEDTPPALAAAFVALFAAVQRIEFRLGDGHIVPTQLVFVPMLLLLPTAMVPLLCLLATVANGCVEVARRRRSWHRTPLAINDAAFALAPAAVLIVYGAQTPNWGDWPVYVLALAAQLGVETARETLRAWLGAGVRPRTVIAEMMQVHRVDALLAPIGLLAAFAAVDAPLAVVLVLPLIWMLRMFAREREARIEQTIELGRAYRGTALLLRDLLEEDDEYTGHHTEDVVELSVRVADRMGVSEDVRRETELGALLHDIGKIAIPDEIINKPGPLDDDE